MRIVKFFIRFLVKLLNSFIREKKYIYFIPHPNCRKDLYDIINYSSDNVLSFLNYCLHNNKFKDRTVCVQVFNNKRIESYVKYAQKLSPDLDIRFVLSDYCAFEDYSMMKAIRVYLIHYMTFCRSLYIFTDTYWYDYRYKATSQKIVCLNYFTPFKLDHFSVSFDRSFDFCITTSSLFAQINSLATGISYHKYLPLGFPRNDNLILNSNKKNDSIDFLLKDVPYEVKEILIYTPTYRDYDICNTQKRNLFGYSDDSDSLLSELLRRHNAILFVKLHPLQRLDVFYTVNSTSIILLSPSNNYNLYQLLSLSSLLITDYTSTYFDYLLLNRPVLFNFYDVEVYKSVRGFSFDPIDSVCLGEVVYSYEMLIKSVSDFFNGELSIEKNPKLFSLFHKYRDSYSNERIFNYFFEQSFSD